MTTTGNRKVFISFLGASLYRHCVYVVDGGREYDSRFIQEVMLRHFAAMGGWTAEDHAYILLTDVAERNNWHDAERTIGTGEVVSTVGLEATVREAGLPMTVEPVRNIPPGNDEGEIMEIFGRIYDLIEEGDELYFDITHGFRYLPMITLVLGNYSKFLKGVTVRWIGYGNYEGRDIAANRAPVVDLTSVSLLQDWTNAAADFINNGNAGAIASLTSQRLQPILRETRGADANASAIHRMSGALQDMAMEMKYCRGRNIVSAKSVKLLEQQLGAIEDCMIEPLTPLLEKIRHSISGFDTASEENVANGFAAADWCLGNDMSQQAATILQETVITAICMRNGLDYKDKPQRDVAVLAINSQGHDFEISLEEAERIRGIVENEPLLANKDFIDCYTSLSDLRNDLNHCGMRENPRQIKNIKKKLQKLCDMLKELCSDNTRQP